jgi:hypothetical protein
MSANSPFSPPPSIQPNNNPSTTQNTPPFIKLSFLSLSQRLFTLLHRNWNHFASPVANCAVGKHVGDIQLFSHNVV